MAWLAGDQAPSGRPVIRKIAERQEDPAERILRLLEAALADRQRNVRIQGLSGSSRALLCALAFARTGRPLVALSPSDKEAARLYRDLVFFLGQDKVCWYPARDALSMDLFTARGEEEVQRMASLHRLVLGEAAVVVASLAAALQRTIPRAVFTSFVEIVAPGDVLDRDALAAKLLAGGYRRVPLVEAPGDFSFRGHVIDLFPPTLADPLRVECFGDEVEGIRVFDPVSQRSRGPHGAFMVSPAREIILAPERTARAAASLQARARELELPRTLRERLAEVLGGGLASSFNPLFLSLFYAGETGQDRNESPGTLCDFFPAATLLALDDPPALGPAREALENDLDRLLLEASRKKRFFLERDAFWLGKEAWEEASRPFQTLSLEGLVVDVQEDAQERDGTVISLACAADLLPPRPTGRDGGGDGLLAPLVEKIRSWLEAGDRVALVCAGPEERQRMAHLVRGYGLDLREDEAPGPFLSLWAQWDGRPGLHILEGRLAAGFRLSPLRLALVSDEEIFGRKQARRRRPSAREGFFLRSFGELANGDPVVHKDHGIGVYRGLQTLTVGGLANDFLFLEYAEGDKLYLPVDRLDQIQRYIGPEGHAPRLDRLGGSSWEHVKAKAKQSIREMAEELVSIYAAREVMEREAFSPPDRVYEEFCSAFEYEETPDQARAIAEVEFDMNGAKPMDRLVCGDAGFGKTEVALRAALRATMDGRQVAVLVPTTILAEQHFQTFSRRFARLPVTVHALDRFRSRAEQRTILEGLQKGTADIVIGTHRLLQKDVRFRNLGLVIIDEEQRFGVAHKEKLKKLRTLVDVLTLSATPIPRTLHLSLVGIRDLSIINTPPEDRQPIETRVREFSEEAIQKAIRRELERGGQVFFLHDRVRSIFSMARLVGRLVPEARVAVVHGQMKTAEIEQAMTRFVAGTYDVLVCTTIIGSGLDIPTANTILINRADRFGLGQLYQIRGRVGRGREGAFAHLLVPKGALLSRDAQRRLQAIMDFTEPGSGFRIASQDLDIRGAGNLLGASQSGHISAVGYELYTELMEKTIQELRGEPIREETPRPEINLGIPAFIPADFMPNEHQRLLAYKRISLAASDEDLEAIREELTDRFGFVPSEVENLLAIIHLRNRLQRLKAKKASFDGTLALIQLQADTPLNPARLLDLSRKAFPGLRLTPDQKLLVPLDLRPDRPVTDRFRDLLSALGH